MSILTSTTFPEQLEELKTVPFEIKMLRGALNLEQTKRNKVRRELLEGLRNYFEQVFSASTNVRVFETADGIVLELENDSVVKCEESNSGCMCIGLDLSIFNLEYDAFEASLVWEEDKEARERRRNNQ